MGHGHGDAGLNFYFVWASFFWTLLVRKLDTYLTTLLYTDSFIFVHDCFDPVSLAFLSTEMVDLD